MASRYGLEEECPRVAEEPGELQGTTVRCHAEGHGASNHSPQHLGYSDRELAVQAAGIARPSFTSVCLEKINPADDAAHQREVIKDTAGTVFAGSFQRGTRRATGIALTRMVSYSGRRYDSGNCTRFLRRYALLSPCTEEGSGRVGSRTRWSSPRVQRRKRLAVYRSAGQGSIAMEACYALGYED